MFTINLPSRELTLAEANLLLSPEFAQLLGISDRQGADVGDVHTDAELEAIASQTFEVESGVTSVFLDLPLLEEVVNLQLAEVDREAEPFSDHFQVGFAITDETDLSFSFVDDLVLLTGTIEHEGSVTFDLLPPQVNVDLGNVLIISEDDDTTDPDDNDRDLGYTKSQFN